MTQLSGVEPLSRRAWVFCNGDGLVYSRDFELRDDGTIGGYDNPNERRWRTEDGAIVLTRDDGTISCVLQPQEPNSLGEEVYCGEFRLPHAGPAVTHVLKRALPKIGCFLRTHFWDSDVELAYRALADSWHGAVIVSSDQTQAFEIPADIPQIQHSLAKFETYMLPVFSSAVRPMWWNGDYVLYDIFLNTDFDYFIISEYDLYLEFDLRAAVGEIIRSGVEFAAFGVRPEPASSQWQWVPVQAAWDAFEDARGAGSDPGVYGCFFPLTFISRRLAAWLYARRVQGGFALRRPGAPQWPFCESFAATEAARSGLKMADIGRFLPEPQQISDLQAVSWSEIPQRSEKLIHPVLSGDRFVNRVMLYAERLHPQDEPARSEWLYDRVGRLPEGPDKWLLCAEVARRETDSFVAEHLQDLPAFGHPHETLRFALEQVKGGPGRALEFGVGAGTTLRIIADALSHEHDVVGFDCFAGLPEEWRPGFPAGMFAQEQLPIVPGARLVAGMFETTLPGFLEENPGRIAFVHLDADLYSSTSTVLRLLGDRLGPGTVLVFDEFFRYPGWRQHEYRAWCEFIATRDRGYDYLAYTADCERAEQVVIRLR
jgi:predicted O-methyltransferase YrrM